MYPFWVWSTCSIGKEFSSVGGISFELAATSRGNKKKFLRSYIGQAHFREASLKNQAWKNFIHSKVSYLLRNQWFPDGAENIFSNKMQRFQSLFLTK